MTELYQEPVDIAWFHDPVSGESLADLELYLDRCVTLRADPTPHPDQPRTADLAAPIVDRLVRTPSWVRGEIISSLEEGYLLTGEGTEAEGPVNRGQASRNLVAEVIYQAQSIALETNDAELSAQVRGLTYGLIHREATEGDVRGVPGLLASSLQAVVAKDSTLTGQEHGLTDGWLQDVGESLNIRNALVSLLHVDRLNLRDGATVNFLLRQYGLDPHTMLNAWRIGFPADARPEEFAPHPMISENLKRIAVIEARRPGISARLYESNMIRCFARLGPHVLEYLDRDRGEAPGAVVFASLSDGLGLNNTPVKYRQLLDYSLKEGKQFDYYEIGSPEELKMAESKARERNPQIDFVLQKFHSDGYVAAWGETVDTLSTVDDMIRDTERVRAFYAGVTRVALHGCKTGIKNGWADTLSHLIPGTTVNGLSAITPATIKGFMLKEAKPGSVAVGAFGRGSSRPLQEGGHVTVHRELTAAEQAVDNELTAIRMVYM